MVHYASEGNANEYSDDSDWTVARCGDLRRIQSCPCRPMLPITPRSRCTKAKVTPTSKERLPERFQIQNLIGQGSYGCVVEAFDTTNGRMVAVKRVANLFHNLLDCKRVLREIAIMSRLHHPCIVQLYDLPPVCDVSSFNELFMVMELCDTDMGKLLRTDVSLSPLHTTALLYNMLLGLKYIHSAAIYHRDLKPANCLVNADCSVKICDFGLARVVEEEESNACEEVTVQEDSPDSPESPSSPGSPGTLMRRKRTSARRKLTKHIATRWYRAPEIILLQKEYTAAVDVWSVGCIYAELLGMHDGVKASDRRPLFPGSSCHPLSPVHARASTCPSTSSTLRDQMCLIFNLLGTPSSADLDWLDSDESRAYIKGFPEQEGQGWPDAFRGTSDDAMDVLEDTLRFNPTRRPSIEELLDYDLFVESRDEFLEKAAPCAVKLSFEDSSIDELRLRSSIFKEISWFSRTFEAAAGA